MIPTGRTPFLILRRLKIERDPLAAFSTSDSHNDKELWPDFEYDGDENGEDGYEINFFETTKQTVSKNRPYEPIYKVTKKYLGASFIGNRQPGEIGEMDCDYKRNGATYSCKFSDDITGYYMGIVKEHYESCKTCLIKPQIETDPDKVLSLILPTIRDNRITQVIQD